MNDVGSSVPSQGPVLQRVWQWVFTERWLICFVLAALAVRLHWNLEVHPGSDYIYSDMRGYMDRANGIFKSLWGAREYNGFYPYGTHVYLYAVMAVFGKGNHTAIASSYAVMGAALVGYGYLLARRVSRHSFVPPIVGAILVCYYPLISLGGYYLSEVPFSLCMVAASFHLMRMVDAGKKRDAWAMGVFVALAFTLRPQILASVMLIGLAWVVFRKRIPKARLMLWVQALVPLLVVMGWSSYRLHHHTGRYGVISENGYFNQVFGRCHTKKITALPDKPHRFRTSFGPPPFIQIAKRPPDMWPALDPALDIHYQYRGYIGDKKILSAYVRRCVEKTGYVKQIEYSFVNVLLLWRFNVMWPDSGKGNWQPYSRKWGYLFANTFAVPALLALFGLFYPRRYLKLGLLGLHIWALLGIAAIYIGGARFRCPYDPILILLAVELYAAGIVGVVHLVRGRLARRNPGNESGVQEVGERP